MWAKVDDGWWCHPKVMGLSMASRGLWVSALSWSCAQRRDVVPESFLRMLGADEAHAEELADAALWVVADDGWRIHDWAEYQELSESEKKAAAGRKGGLASGKTRAARSKAKQTGSKQRSKGEANGEAGPVPSRPEPDPSPPPPDSQSDPVPEQPGPMAPVVDDQQIRRTAVLVGQALAAGATDTGAYAATVTKRILLGDDPTDRDEIHQALTDGQTPEMIASWRAAAQAANADPLAGLTGHRRPAATEPDPAEIRDRALRREAETLARADDLAAVERAPRSTVQAILAETRGGNR